MRDKRNHTYLLLAAIVVALGSTTTVARAQFNFDASVEYGLLLSPSGMTSGDFDGDGDMDLATTAGDPDRVIVFLNAGDGTFATTVDSLLPSGSSPQDLIAGDLDGDTDVDLAVALRSDPDGAVRLMLNNGAASFSMGASIAVGERPQGLSIGDLEADGDMDLAVANRLSDTVSILVNDGFGAFTATQVTAGAEPRDTTIGDLLGDAALEVAVTNHDDRTFSILSDSGGSFVSVMTMLVGDPIRPDGIVAADLDGDGLDDLAMATTHFAGPGDNANLATVFINNGAGFDGPIDYDTGGTTSTEIIAADVDCDGSLDLVVSNTDSNDLSLLPNNGDGTFGEGQRLPTGSGPSKAASADLDGDESPDLAVANSVSGDVSVLMNRTCLTGDINRDGVVDMDDVPVFVAVLAGVDTDPNHVAASDMNNDGGADGLDVRPFVAAMIP